MQSELECVVYSILQFTIAYENIHYNMLEYTGYIIIYHDIPVLFMVDFDLSSARLPSIVCAFSEVPKTYLNSEKTSCLGCLMVGSCHRSLKSR